MLGARAPRRFVTIGAPRPDEDGPPRRAADHAGAWVSVVIAPSSRDAATRILDCLADEHRAQPLEVVVVAAATMRIEPLAPMPGVQTLVVDATGCSASGARNLGVRAARGDWVVLLDDDAIIDGAWYGRLIGDLRRAGRNAAGVVAATAGATSRSARLGADVAYRRLVVLALGGFQERFPRDGCHPDLELAQRMTRAGWDVVPGARSGASNRQ